jgi:hypothetical protein
MKKLVLAIIVAYIVLMGTNYLVHSVWLMPDYDAIAASHRNAEGIMHRFWAMALGQFFFAAMFAYIYTRGREAVAGAGNSVWNRDDLHDRGAVLVERIYGLYRSVPAGHQVDDCRRNSTADSGLDRRGDLQARRIRLTAYAP